jgi:hypothetical protein
MGMQHDATYEEIEVDSQTTAWVFYCKRCKRRSRPIYRRDEVDALLKEASCPGERKGD